MEKKSVDNQWKTCQHAVVEYKALTKTSDESSSAGGIVKRLSCAKRRESAAGPDCFGAKCPDYVRFDK